MSQEIKSGRPTTYVPEICDELVEFFDRPLYIQREIIHGPKNNPKTDIVTEPNRLPTVEGFCAMKRMSKSTFYLWVKTHEAFSHAFDIAKQIQKDFLNHHASTNGYNASYAKFMAINMTDMKDVQQINHDLGDSAKEAIQLKYGI